LFKIINLWINLDQSLLFFIFFNNHITFFKSFIAEYNIGMRAVAYELKHECASTSTYGLM